MVGAEKSKMARAGVGQEQSGENGLAFLGENLDGRCIHQKTEREASVPDRKRSFGARGESAVEISFARPRAVQREALPDAVQDNADLFVGPGAKLESANAVGGEAAQGEFQIEQFRQ